MKNLLRRRSLETRNLPELWDPYLNLGYLDGPVELWIVVLGKHREALGWDRVHIQPKFDRGRPGVTFTAVDEYLPIKRSGLASGLAVVGIAEDGSMGLYIGPISIKDSVKVQDGESFKPTYNTFWEGERENPR